MIGTLTMGGWGWGVIGVSPSPKCSSPLGELAQWTVWGYLLCWEILEYMSLASADVDVESLGVLFRLYW